MKSTLPYLVLCFLFLVFSGIGSIDTETTLFGLPIAKAEEGTKPSQTTNTRPCKPTPPDALGPFYVPNSPERTRVDAGHMLCGIVRSSVDCSPVIGVRIEFWLAGPDGNYDDDHRATMFSDKTGLYKFESNFPPPYRGRPPHIHMKIKSHGFEVSIVMQL